MTDRPMKRREAVTRLASLALAPLAAPMASALAAPAILRGRYRVLPGVGREYSARAVKLVEESIVVDMLNQFRFADHSEKPPRSERWLRVPRSFTKEDFETYRTSGIRVFALGHSAGSYESGIRFFADWNSFIAAYGDWFVRIDEVADFEKARRDGKVGIMLTFQDAAHFRTPDDVDVFFGLGQRASQLTYNFQNRIGAGFLEANDGGLTVFGASIVRRMNQVGMAVDLSHSADRTTMDGLAATSKPAIFSHASCRALVPGYQRAKTDEAIRALAKTGGVMGVAFLRFLVHDREPTGVEHVVNHVEHVAKLVGIEHVGMGSDMDVVGNPNPVGGAGLAEIQKQPNFDRYHYRTGPDGKITIQGLDHARRVFDFTEGLIARRHSDADIALVLGGNWVRVLSEIWPA